MSKKEELDFKPLFDAISLIANENLKIIKKIEKGEPVSEIEYLILIYSDFGFSILNNRFKKQKRN